MISRSIWLLLISCILPSSQSQIWNPFFYPRNGFLSYHMILTPLNHILKNHFNYEFEFWIRYLQLVSHCWWLIPTEKGHQLPSSVWLEPTKLIIMQIFAIITPQQKVSHYAALDMRWLHWLARSLTKHPSIH